MDVITDPEIRVFNASESTSQQLIARSWRGYQVRKHFLPFNIYLLSKSFLKSFPDLDKLPKSSSGSAPVYFPPDLPVVFKMTGRKKSLMRMNIMHEVRSFCERREYKHLKIPRARPYENFIIEEKLPIMELKQKEQVALYCKNKERFSQAIKEFTKLLCQTEYPDILTSIHPYQQEKDIPLARYDNIPLFLECEEGMIGLIDLEDVKIKQKRLSEDQVLEVAKKAVLLFPLHLREILDVLRDFFPEMSLDFSSLCQEHAHILRNFNAIYFDHSSFIEKKPQLREKLVLDFRIDEIKSVLLKEFNSSEIERSELFFLVDQLISQIEINIEWDLLKNSNQNNLNLRTLSFPVKNLLLSLPLDPCMECIIKRILEELKKGSEICFGNLYYNHSKNLFIRVHI